MKKLRSHRRKDRLLSLFLGMCTVGLLGSGAALTCKWQEGRWCIGEMESLAAVVRPEESVQSAAGQAKYHLLQEENPDFAGWISIPGTKIDYPVMQSLESPDYYLDHSFSRKASRYGVPYIAKDCSPVKDCPNIVLYGHHMKNGTMFADLVNYTEESYFQDHPRIRFDTLKASSEYQIIGVLLIPAVEAESSFYLHMQAADPDTYRLFVDEVKARSLYDTHAEARYGDRLLTLITCEYTRKEGRMVVVAKEIEYGTNFPAV